MRTKTRMSLSIAVTLVALGVLMPLVILGNSGIHEALRHQQWVWRMMRSYVEKLDDYRAAQGEFPENLALCPDFDGENLKSQAMIFQPRTRTGPRSG